MKYRKQQDNLTLIQEQLSTYLFAYLAGGKKFEHHTKSGTAIFAALARFLCVQNIDVVRSKVNGYLQHCTPAKLFLHR